MMTIKAPKLRNQNDDYLHAISEPWYRSLLFLQSEIVYYTYEFYRNEGISATLFPVTSTSVSSPMGLGSDSLPVSVNIMGVETYLADSMQFFLEYGCRFIKKGCFYIMPSFRGEPTDERHLSQFFHSEVEIPGGQNDIIFLAEKYIKFLASELLKNCSSTIKEIAGTVKHLENLLKVEKIQQITYKDAVNFLKISDGEIREENGLIYVTSVGEKRLIDEYKGFIWLTNMDSRIVPFYQATCKEDSRYASCADLLFGIGEVIGAGARCVSKDEVLKSLSLHNVDATEYDWYIRMKENYPMQTAGFGMGIERFLLWVLKHEDIRDCQLVLRQNGIISGF